MPINIKNLEIQNFKSFGDYLTKIELNDLGPVLIVGDCEIPQKGEKRSVKAARSNGAGKSSLISAIVWALWGRTNDKARPGDTVINWSTQKNCYVKIETTDGYTIIRTRKYKGKDDLVFYKEGQDQTLSTNTAAQTAINKTFGLDYNIFSSSVFFEQRAKPLLEMTPKQRQTTIERMLQLHKLHYRADVAKEYLKKEESEQSEFLSEKKLYERDLNRLKEDLKDAEEQRSLFEQQRLDRIIDVEKRLKTQQDSLKEIILPNIEDLESKWNLVEQIESKATELKEQRNLLDVETSKYKASLSSYKEQKTEISHRKKNQEEIDIENLEQSWEVYDKKLKIIEQKKIQLQERSLNLKNLDFQAKDKSKSAEHWKDQAGKICPTCKQTVSSDHTEHVAKPILTELAEIINKRTAIQNEIVILEEDIKDSQKEAESMKPYMHVEVARSMAREIEVIDSRLSNIELKMKEFIDKLDDSRKKIHTINSMLDKINLTLANKRPHVTIAEANLVIQKHESIKNTINNLDQEKTRIKDEQNPYIGTISKIKDNITVNEIKYKDLDDKTTKKDILIKHYSYIKKAYSDKGKIKGLILNGMIPVLNNRLRYYLDQFGFEIVDLEFNNLLELESSKWDYTSCSGGERQCLDLALMFALYDMNALQYGRQSNLMVLDEVDGRLDASYVERLASVIVDDLSKQGATRPSTVLVVSHKNDMFDAFPTKIVVRKENGFSHVDIEK